MFSLALFNYSITATCEDPNETYSECGTACQLNCDNYQDEIECTEECVQGCFCNEGYVRGADGSCILEEDCSCNYYLKLSWREFNIIV